MIKKLGKKAIGIDEVIPMIITIIVMVIIVFFLFITKENQSSQQDKVKTNLEIRTEAHHTLTTYLNTRIDNTKTIADVVVLAVATDAPDLLKSSTQYFFQNFDQNLLSCRGKRYYLSIYTSSGLFFESGQKDCISTLNIVKSKLPNPEGDFIEVSLGLN